MHKQNTIHLDSRLITSVEPMTDAIPAYKSFDLPFSCNSPNSF
jgi:hypothetical protein